MPRVRYEQEARDTAFAVWRGCGQNVAATLRELKNEYGYKHLAKPTLYNWMQEYHWKDRDAKLVMQERQEEEAQLVGRERILTDLVKRKQELDQYFADQPTDQPDNATLNSYLNLARMILQVQQQLDKDRNDIGVQEDGVGLAALTGA